MRVWFTILAVAMVLALVGCNSGGGSVDTNAVQKQADKEKQVNDAQKSKLPPGEGPSG